MDSVLRAVGHSLALQFLEGVRFLHEHKVAHLDLKDTNIVITPTMQLQIIDYDVSVLGVGPESWIVGYRGTKGWAAPELEHDPDGKFQPIPADLWSAGRVLESIYSRIGDIFGFAVIMRRLLRDNPRERPYLSEVLQDTPLAKLKRDLLADVATKEGDKRQTCATHL